MSLLDPIPEAIEAIRNGEIIIVVDDEDRENEGDFLTAARNVTPEVINFMATHGRGLICAPLIEDRCDELGLELMVSQNNAAYETPFTVSVDLIGHGCTTGISASDRSKTPPPDRRSSESPGTSSLCAQSVAGCCAEPATRRRPSTSLDWPGSSRLV